jgi:hypothetical protein
MTFARRLAAATMALVLALFPLALDRCRTACVTGSTTTQAATGGHACHEAAADESGTRMDPMARACGHNSEARTYESVTLAAGKTRTVVLLVSTQPEAAHLQVTAVSPGRVRAPNRLFLSHVVLPLHLPLRL